MGKVLKTGNGMWKSTQHKATQGYTRPHKATGNNMCSNMCGSQSQVLQLLVLRNAGLQLLFLRASIGTPLVFAVCETFPASVEVHERQRLCGRGSLTLAKTHQGTFKEPTIDLDKHAANDRRRQKTVQRLFASTVLPPCSTHEPPVGQKTCAAPT